MDNIDKTLQKKGLENYVRADPYGKTSIKEFEEYNVNPLVNFIQ